MGVGTISLGAGPLPSTSSRLWARYAHHGACVTPAADNVDFRSVCAPVTNESLRAPIPAQTY